MVQWLRLQAPSAGGLDLIFGHGQRSLAGYSPWGCKESDTTERLSTAHGTRCQTLQLRPSAANSTNKQINKYFLKQQQQQHKQSLRAN